MASGPAPEGTSGGTKSDATTAVTSGTGTKTDSTRTIAAPNPALLYQKIALKTRR